MGYNPFSYGNIVNFSVWNTKQSCIVFIHEKQAGLNFKDPIIFNVLHDFLKETVLFIKNFQTVWKFNAWMHNQFNP